jgi:hypothetical protein
MAIAHDFDLRLQQRLISPAPRLLRDGADGVFFRPAR